MPRLVLALALGLAACGGAASVAAPPSSVPAAEEPAALASPVALPIAAAAHPLDLSAPRRYVVIERDGARHRGVLDPATFAWQDQATEPAARGPVHDDRIAHLQDGQVAGRSFLPEGTPPVLAEPADADHRDATLVVAAAGAPAWVVAEELMAQPEARLVVVHRGALAVLPYTLRGAGDGPTGEWGTFRARHTTFVAYDDGVRVMDYGILMPPGEQSPEQAERAEAIEAARRAGILGSDTPPPVVSHEIVLIGDGAAEHLVAALGSLDAATVRAVVISRMP